MTDTTVETAGATHTTAPALEISGLTKRFGSVVANDDVTFDVHAGEVHVLLGENGAGKSTLMNMVYGHLQPDAGGIRVAGKTVRIHSPAQALELGIGMVHQHFSLVPSFTVAQNVYLGAESIHGRLSPAELVKRVQQIADDLGWSLDVRRITGDLPVSAQQQVEILKLLYRGATILLLDEPTALLAPAEIDALLGTIETLRARGAAIVLVTHKLREISSAADRVTVIRHGRTTGELRRGEFDEAGLAQAMTGRDTSPLPERRADVVPVPAGEPVFVVDALTIAGVHGTVAIDSLSFDVRPGEILGIAGVEGNGQHELIEALSGLRSVSSGRVRISGTDITSQHPAGRRRSGIAIVPSDRREWGVVGDLSLADNLALSRIALGKAGRGKAGRGALLDQKSIKRHAQELVTRFDIRPTDVDARAGGLSGGNMQKLVVARELDSNPVVLVASSPTWGLDVGAVSDVHDRIREARDAGCAVVLQSLDLDEVLALADRVIVLYRGRVTLEADRDDVTVEAISVAMIGG